MDTPFVLFGCLEIHAPAFLEENEIWDSIFNFLDMTATTMRAGNVVTWSAAYHLALTFGWEPEGTTFGYAPCGATEADAEELAKDWDGNYWTNDGQIVRRSDAANLAAALRHALRFVPTEKMAVQDEDPELPQALSRFSGEGREYLARFLTFVERGGFVIF